MKSWIDYLLSYLCDRRARRIDREFAAGLERALKAKGE